ncbi:hypothetical protein DNL40_06425 [Xylanimonas oleitrophica]|uniref:Uncharacterized protein n=1 Tax=Xylanimonas oleitrophica TaxID=2607479 RepID=A0A2W5X0I8_9MICO|nr:hypothetical protein DNL40_06425 [Xylanimonas oleitrophica]
MTGREAVHTLGGQFRPGVVLRGRALALLGGTVTVGALVTAAAAAGGGSAREVVLWAAAGGLTAPAALAVGAAAQVAVWRREATVLASVLLAVGVAAATAPRPVPLIACARVATGEPVPCSDPGPGVAGLVLAAVTAAVSCWVVLRTVPARLDVDDVAARGARFRAAGEGLGTGDALAVSRAVGVRPRGPRRVWDAGRPLALLTRAPVLARDLLGLRRRPWTTATATAAGITGSFLLLAVPETAGTVVGAVLLYVAVCGVAGGLAAFSRQPVPGGLFPGSAARVHGAHLLAPALVAALAIVTGAVLAAVATVLRDPAPRADATLVVALAALTVTVRAWVLSSTVVPAALFTPVASPLGDLSVVTVLAYHLRGWLVVSGAAWLAATAEGDAAWGPTAVVAVLFGWSAARKAGQVRE